MVLEGEEEVRRVDWRRKGKKVNGSWHFFRSSRSTLIVLEGEGEGEEVRRVDWRRNKKKEENLINGISGSLPSGSRSTFLTVLWRWRRLRGLNCEEKIKQILVFCGSSLSTYTRRGLPSRLSWRGRSTFLMILEGEEANKEVK